MSCFTRRGLTRHIRSAHRGNSQGTSRNNQGEGDGTVDELSRAYNSPYIGDAGSSDGVWRERWMRVVQLGGKQYDLPSGRTGYEFVDKLGQEIELLVAGESPSERVLVFIAIILQRDKAVKQAKDIRITLQQRIKLWEAGEFVPLIEITEEADKKLKRSRARMGDDEHKVKVFHRLVLRGKVREALRWLTEGGGGKILGPRTELDSSSRTVMDELKDKHPSPINPDAQCYELPTNRHARTAFATASAGHC
ncbi:hypothetical protein GE061_017087 [Apolygus lucorum]|uniref:Uncharacterized protein n=1 Tax=Apolygus lucorum TaxID=248454 RepID=A0A8S9XJ54_APOLU|nr:hypothetical protein GE061_017087 [Apolygus lucorum]